MDIRNIFFKNRSFTPLPILIMILYYARPNSSYLIFGILFIFLGEFIRVCSVSYAGGETRTMNVGGSAVCKSGPYSYIRNPLYVGNMFLYVGLTLIAGSPNIFIVTLITFTFFFIQYSLIISLEEEALEKKFGEEYVNYKNEVPSIIPKFNSKFNKMIKPIFSRVEKKTNDIKISPDSNFVEQLKSLNELYKSGVLTKEEFEKAKKKILN